MPSSCTRMYAHLVWGTWRREPLIATDVEPRLHACIASACANLKCSAMAVAGVADHRHVLVRMHSTASASALAKAMKGSSSHLMTHVIAPTRFFRWQDGYGAFSVSAEHVDRVARYVARQRDHHRDGSTVTEWERCTEDDGPSAS